MRFVALGDSLTQGVGDPRPGRAGFRGELDGWVVRLTESLSAADDSVEVQNLAVAGARLEHVLARQVPLIAGPAELISCFVGVNDLWNVNIDLDRFAARYDLLVRQLTGLAPTVLTATIHDLFAPFPMRDVLRERLNANVAAMNDVIRSTSGSLGAVLFDVGTRAALFGRNVKAVDLLHPNRYGHQLIAAEVLRELQRHGRFPGLEPPTAQPTRRGLTDVAHVAWVAGYVRRNWRQWRIDVVAARAAAAGVTAPQN